MPMSDVRIYHYDRCDTCRKAVKFLKERGIVPQMAPIREQPPTVAELQRMLAITGSLRRLFNTSGGDYKAMNLAVRLPDLSETDALDLLSKHGNLMKRPFLLTGDGRGVVGFKPEEWEALFPLTPGGPA